MKRHVLHFVTSYVSNQYMYNQIVGIQGFKPIVYGGQMLKTLPFEHFFKRQNTASDLEQIFSLYTLQIIHAHFGTLGADAAPFAQKHNIRLVTHFRGGDGSNDPYVREKFKRKYSLLAEQGDLFLPVCEALVPMLVDLGLPKEKIHVLYGGIDIDQFLFQERNFEAKEKFIIGFVGKTSPKKGLFDLLDAFTLLAGDFNHLELRLVVSSPQSKVDREVFNRLQDLITERNLEDSVIFQFDVNNLQLHEELNRFHVFCHPSRMYEGNMEGIPNALKEAMATGLPSVSTYHAGIPELINSGTNGLLVPESDPLSLADALAELITKPSLCRKFALAGRETVAERFNLVKQLQVQKNLYDSLCLVR